MSLHDTQHPARTPRQIGALLRRHRRAKDISQAELGARTGLRQATISAIESGAPGTELKTLCDVVAALGLELTVRRRTSGTPDDIEHLF